MEQESKEMSPFELLARQFVALEDYTKEPRNLCGECGELIDDARIKAGLKCSRCAYGSEYESVN